MIEARHITIQRLMDRFLEVACDLFDRHFNDDFLIDRFIHVEQALFLVMVLNYVEVAEPVLFYSELAFHPREGAAAATQEEPSRKVFLSAGDLLHFSLFLNENLDRPDGRWVRALIASSLDEDLVGCEVILDYSDCLFIGYVTADD